MNKKKYIIAIFGLIFLMIFSQRNYAKYIMSDNLEMSVYIDKTPPIIDIITNGEKETFPTTDLDNSIKRTTDIIVNTSDNKAIKENEYYYNPSDKNFDGLDSNKFENGKQLIDEGYYKIVAIDTSGNKTEIIVLLDKSAPVVYVQYFKKGEVSTVLQESTPTKQVAAIRKYLKSQEVINTDNMVDNNIIENSVCENITGENVVNEEIAETTTRENTVKITETIEETTNENTVESIEEITETTEEIINEDTEENIEEMIEQSETVKYEMTNSETLEEFKPMLQSESDVMVMSAGDVYVGNETEFRNALATQASVIHIRDSINFSSPIVVDYPLTIVREGEQNSLRYFGSGDFIIVPNTGSLVLDGVVVDTNSSGNSGVTAINIQSGGSVTFINSSIVDRRDFKYWNIN